MGWGIDKNVHDDVKTRQRSPYSWSFVWWIHRCEFPKKASDAVLSFDFYSAVEPGIELRVIGDVTRVMRRHCYGSPQIGIQRWHIFNEIIWYLCMANQVILSQNWCVSLLDNSLDIPIALMLVINHLLGKLRHTLGANNMHACTKLPHMYMMRQITSLWGRKVMRATAPLWIFNEIT